MQSKSTMGRFEAAVEKFITGTDEFIKHEQTRRWPAVVGLLAITVAYAFLSDSYQFFGLAWIFIALNFVSLIVVRVLKRRGNQEMVHTVLVGLCTILTIYEAASIVRLIASLPDKTVPAATLLVNAGILWATNIIIFGYWYWLIEGGGPQKRSELSVDQYHKQAELLFPQLTLLEQRPQLAKWRPDFVDYIFVSFNTSTAYSPTDTPVLSLRIKGLSILQSVLSLATTVTLAARAINLL